MGNSICSSPRFQTVCDRMGGSRMNVCPSYSHPSALSSGNPRGLTEEMASGDHRVVPLQSGVPPGPRPCRLLEKRGILFSLYTAVVHTRRLDSQAGRLRGRQLPLPGDRFLSASSPPPTGSSAASERSQALGSGSSSAEKEEGPVLSHWRSFLLMTELSQLQGGCLTSLP